MAACQRVWVMLASLRNPQPGEMTPEGCPSFFGGDRAQMDTDHDGARPTGRGQQQQPPAKTTARDHPSPLGPPFQPPFKAPPVPRAPQTKGKKRKKGKKWGGVSRGQKRKRGGERGGKEQTRKKEDAMKEQGQGKPSQARQGKASQGQASQARNPGFPHSAHDP